jgi:queuine/archaeosine tRNA-ribosyltransferase
VQLTFDADVEAFRTEFVAFLDQHLPPDAQTSERSRSSSHTPRWARRWQRLMFERYIRSFGGTIAGGTSEIQRNIIAQRVLGLPRN